MAKQSNFSDQFGTSALPVLSDLIYDEFDRLPDYTSEIFRVYNTSQWGEQTSTMAGIKAAPSKSEGAAVAFDDPIQGYDKTFTMVTYSIATSFTEELMEDDRMNMAEDTLRSLGLSMYQTKQIQCFGVFNDGFTTTGPDGATLFSTSHSLVGGGTSANRPSSEIALSVAGLREMDIALMKQVNHRNINIVCMPSVLVVPPDLRQTAHELIKSTDRPDTSNRATNVYNEMMKVIVSPFLTSTTAWMVIADKNTHQLRFYNRVAPTVKTWVDEKTGDVNTRIRCRFDVGYSDFIGTWGTTG